LIGLLFLIGAVIISVLNLHRVANLGITWLPPILIVFGALLVVFARKASRN